jgi:hypothetical protein
VHAAAANRAARLSGAPVTAPLRIGSPSAPIPTSARAEGLRAGTGGARAHRARRPPRTSPGCSTPGRRSSSATRTAPRVRGAGASRARRRARAPPPRRRPRPRRARRGRRPAVINGAGSVFGTARRGSGCASSRRSSAPPPPRGLARRP